MSTASANAKAYLDDYISAMDSIGKAVTILRPYQKDFDAVVSERRSAKYVLKDGEDKEFSTYRGYPVKPILKS